MAEAARARARRPPRHGTRPPRRAVDRVACGVGRGGCRRTDAARGAAAAMAATGPRGVGIAPRRRVDVANVDLASRTASFRPTWSRATARLPRLRSGRGHRCSRTATCRSTTCSSTLTRSPAWSTGPRRVQGDALYDLASLTLGHEEHLGRRRRRLRHRCRRRRDPRVVVVAQPVGDPLARRARLRPVSARLRGRRAEIPDVRLAADPPRNHVRR